MREHFVCLPREKLRRERSRQPCKTLYARGSKGSHSRRSSIQLTCPKNSSRLFTAYLRLPKRKGDLRVDPEFKCGKFGSTCCHSENLLSNKGMRKGRFSKGGRICFLQGGSSGIRVVFITPPIQGYEKSKQRPYLILHWDSNWANKKSRPLKYKYGMLLTPKLANALNPKTLSNIERNPNRTEIQNVVSSLRAYSQPAKMPLKFIEAYKKHKSQQVSKHGSIVFAEEDLDTAPKR